MIGDVIYSLLSNDATVSGIVGVKIFPSIAMQEIALPYIVYEESNNQPTNTKDGKSELDVVSYDIEIYADNPSDLSTLSYAVRNCLDRYTGIVGGKRIDSVKYVSENTGYSLEDRVYLRVHNYDFRYFPLVQTLRQPTSLVATGNTSDITLTWVDNATGETGYKVYRGTSLYDLDLLATIAANLQTYVDSTPLANTVYYYYVVPYSSLGNGYASNVVAQKLGNITEITFTFDNNLIAVVDTSPYNIDCTTVLDVAIITNNATFNGTYTANGTQNGQTKYVNTVNSNLVIIGGAAWQVKNLVGATINQDPPTGQDYPWEANWGGQLTMVQATIETYCSEPCAAATYTIKDSANTTLYSGSIASGGNLNQTITDSTVNVRKSDNVLISAVAVEAQATDNYLVSDSAVTVNGNAYANVKATDSLDVAVEYSDTTNVGTIGGGIVVIPNNRFNTASTIKTGQTTSYNAGDDGDLERGSGVDFLTLSYNNPYGNTSRFTDSAGGQTYANGEAYDWGNADYVNRIVPVWYLTPQTAATWANAMTNQPYTVNSQSWYIPNIQEAFTIINMGSATSRLNYAPFNLTSSASGQGFWTSNTNFNDTTLTVRIYVDSTVTASRGFGLASLVKTTAANFLLIRYASF